MITTYKAAPDIDVLTSNFPVPGFGLIPINAFVLHAGEPVLVECDVSSAREAIAGRYLGAAAGGRFAAQRRSTPGVLLRLLDGVPRVWDLSAILPA